MDELLNKVTPQINKVKEKRQAKGITMVMKSTWWMLDFLSFELFLENAKKFSSSNLFLDKINPLFLSSWLFLIETAGSSKTKRIINQTSLLSE